MLLAPLHNSVCTFPHFRIKAPAKWINVYDDEDVDVDEESAFSHSFFFLLHFKVLALSSWS